MKNITNDRLTRCGTGCFIAVPVWQQWASKVSSQVVSSTYRSPAAVLHS